MEDDKLNFSFDEHSREYMWGYDVSRSRGKRYQMLYFIFNENLRMLVISSHYTFTTMILITDVDRFPYLSNVYFSPSSKNLLINPQFTDVSLPIEFSLSCKNNSPFFLLLCMRNTRTSTIRYNKWSMKHRATMMMSHFSFYFYCKLFFTQLLYFHNMKIRMRSLLSIIRMIMMMTTTHWVRCGINLWYDVERYKNNLFNHRFNDKGSEQNKKKNYWTFFSLPNDDFFSMFVIIPLEHHITLPMLWKNI